MAKRRIGILGGSFNPPHIGHLRMAEQAHKALNLSEVWLLVSPQNPLKQTVGMAPFADRMHMCELLANGRPWLKASAFEAEAQTQFTADTVQKLTTCVPDATFFWLMGADNLAQFHKWKNWEQIVKTLPIVVFRRPGTNTAEIAGPAADYLKPYKVEAQSSKVDAPNWRILDNDLVDLSATDIRLGINAGAAQSDKALPNEVQRYINAKKLYQNAAVC